jgi:hypothetical protein
LYRYTTGEKSELATVEQYFLQVMPIPRLQERINALVFKAGLYKCCVLLLVQKLTAKLGIETACTS